MKKSNTRGIFELKTCEKQETSEQDVIEGRISATMAVKSLIEIFEGH
ncbi:hypothetical protein [Pelosinus fermentans]|nr:hypothetical protein [Pelosinus fermentans]